MKVDNTSWCSPIVPVKKLDGTVRVCVDYRAVNDRTLLMRHYMPTLDELLDKAGGCGALSTLDLTAGFHQLEVAEEDRDITTFGSPWGTYKFNRMPFGLKNAPAIFQQAVDGVLASVNDVSGCYIDDVLIYTKTWDEHLVALRRVLACLSKAGLTVKLKKCSFGKSRLRYLGHLIGGGRLSVPNDRVTVLAEWPLPSTKRQLKRFLGTVGFYRKFVKDFAAAAALLTPMTTKGAPDTLVWIKEGESAFTCLSWRSFVCAQFRR